jgi:hypothetical protein
VIDRTSTVFLDNRVISPSQPSRVIATVRDDLEWKVLRIDALRSAFDLHREFVVGIDATAARELIEEPARVLGVRVEAPSTIATEVGEELSRHPANLPLVQFALTEWWCGDAPNGALTLASWRSVGGIAGALTSVADRFYESLDNADRETVKHIFQRMFRGDSKRPIPEREVDVSQWQQLLSRLVEHRLVRSYGSSDAGRWYEPAHEALARRWERLRVWLGETAADDALLDELELATALWRRQGSPRDVELPAHKLQRALELRHRLDVDSSAFLLRVAENAEAARNLEATSLSRMRNESRLRAFGYLTAGGSLVILAFSLLYWTRSTQQLFDTEARAQREALRAAEDDADAARARVAAEGRRVDDHSLRLTSCIAELQRAQASHESSKSESEAALKKRRDLEVSLAECERGRKLLESNTDAVEGLQCQRALLNCRASLSRPPNPTTFDAAQ